MTQFCDLHAHSTYSVLDGFSTPEEMAQAAASLGRTAMALTDHGSVSGHVVFEKACLTAGIKPIYGCEAYITADARGEGRQQKKSHLSILAKNATGYRNLSKLVTRSYDQGFYYRPTIDPKMLLEHKEGLMILSGCETSHFMKAIAGQEFARAKGLAEFYRSEFGDDFRIEVQHYPHCNSNTLMAWHLAERMNIPTVLTCDSHYIKPDDWKYQQFLWSVRDGKPIEDDAFRIELAYLWEPGQLLEFCKTTKPEVNWERVFDNTVELGERAEQYRLPQAPHVVYKMEGDKIDYMRKLCIDRLSAEGKLNETYVARMEYELELIGIKQFQDYFLVVSDIINWAKANGVFVGPARGSSCGSLVCYGMHITEIDPIPYGLIFERFIDVSRVDLPDIDCDFEFERRPEVIKYIQERYGAENVASIATFSRFGDKSALDDVAKSYRIPYSEIDIIKRHLVERSSGDQRAELTIQDAIDEHPEAKAAYERNPSLQVAGAVQGRIRHLGRHAAGVIVTTEPIEDYMAVYTIEDSTGNKQRIVAVDWRDAAYMNLMKMDILGLKELSILRMIAESVGMTFQNVYDIPLDDPAVFEAFNSQDFFGIFQYTGFATKGVASRVKFTSLQQVADVNALSRPGPLHAGATESYIRGQAEGSYNPILPQEYVQDIIAPTYGQIVYQEQIMRILREVGHLDWQDVCDIRNIMGKSKGSEAFDKFWPKWEKGCQSNDVGSEDAKQIWECIRLYGKHGFNLAHSVAYGIIAYWSMWFKIHYPIQFYWASLVVRGDGDTAEAVRYIREAVDKGIKFGDFSLKLKHANWYIDDGMIYPGWKVIPGVGEKSALELSMHAPFESLEDIELRVNKQRANAKVRQAVVDVAGRTVYSFFGLDVWDKVLGRIKNRTTIAESNAANEGQFLVAGKVTKINKKNRIEEWKQKGKDVSRLDPSAPQDYVILILEDETDTCMLYFGPDDYAEQSATIWDSLHNFVRVEGNKAGGIQLLAVKKFTMLKS